MVDRPPLGAGRHLSLSLACREAVVVLQGQCYLLSKPAPSSQMDVHPISQLVYGCGHWRGEGMHHLQAKGGKSRCAFSFISAGP